MESNRGDAQKCVKIAQKAHLEGDDKKAIRFLLKSVKLYPSDEAENLLAKLQAPSQNVPKSAANISSRESHSLPDLSHLHGSCKPERQSYTAMQKDLAHRINQCSDYYEILGIGKMASDVDIKKAYRKMALQLHPDKNMAPGSTEAFKAVGKAFSVLSDSEKRRNYDLYGSDAVHFTTRRRHSSSSFDDDDDDDSFDAQDLFNMFFGGGGPSENVRVFRHGDSFYYEKRSTGPENRHRQQKPNPWIHFLPLLIVILVTLLGNIFSSSPAYSLIQHGEYTDHRQTADFGVTYYVKSDFNDNYKKQSPSWRRVEEMVDSEYITSLRNICYQERIQKETLRQRAMYLGKEDMQRKAEKMRTPSCDKLEQMFGRLQY